jgi:MFS family permease
VWTVNPGAGNSRARIPAGIWVLGLVSLFMDVSSEMIHGLLPLYLVGTLGASALAVGFIEGIAEATASVTKLFSGAFSDWLGRRKPLALAGYALAALSKPVFPLAPTLGWVVAARFIDRVGKGIRGAPRDALIAELAPAPVRGASFGLRQALDTVGAFAGPLLAVLCMALLHDDFRSVFWIAVVPAFVAVSLLAFGVSEPESSQASGTQRVPLRASDLRRLGGAFAGVLAIAALLALARFGEAFLILRAASVGLRETLGPLVLVVMNLAYALSAYPAGALSDRVDRRRLLALACAVLVASELALAFSSGLASGALGVGLFGLHLGLSQGLLAALVADTAPPELHGTAFGVFHLVTGVTLLVASPLAGWLWDTRGPGAPFVAGAGFAALALFATLGTRRT